MQAQVTLDEVINIIGDALANSGGEVVRVHMESDRDNTPFWDSMGHLSVMVFLDERLNGELTEAPELADARSVQAIVDILRERRLLAIH